MDNSAALDSRRLHPASCGGKRWEAGGGPMVFPPRFGVNCSTWNNAHGKSAPYVQSKWDERRSAGLKLIFIGRNQDGLWCQLRWEKRAKRMALRLFPSTSAPITASARLAAAAARLLRPNLGINKSQCSPLRGNPGGKMFHVEHCGRITTHHQHQKPTSLSPLGGKEGSLGDGTGSSGPRFGANCCNKFFKKLC